MKILCTVLLALLTAPLVAAPPYVEVEPMTVERAHHTATSLSDGVVLIAGGYQFTCCPGETVVHRSAELFDLARDGFRHTGDMNVPRFLHTATLLPSGKVLIASGMRYLNNSVLQERSAELFDPSTGTFTLTGLMGEGRAGHTATLLRDGRVLIAGGFISSLRPDGTYESVARSAIEMKISEKAGFFAFPAFTGDFQNPEVALKVLKLSDRGDFLLIYDGLTSLEYTIRQHTAETFEKQGSMYRGDILPPPGLWGD